MFRLFLSLILFLFTLHSMAASQSSLKIEGKILPSACDMVMDNGGAVLLGKPGRSSHPLNNSGVLLPKRTIGIHIQCQSPTTFGIRTLDVAENAGNIQYDSLEQGAGFSLGRTNRGEAIGGYIATIDKSRSHIDNRALNNLLSSHDAGNSWQLTRGVLSANGEYIYSWGEKLKPESARTVQLQLTITPFLFDFNNSDSIKIDGITNFEIVYL